MTNELEIQFFQCFGIKPFIYCSKPRLDCDARNKGSCRKDCEYYSSVLYPQITDRILLELIFLQPLSIEFKYPRNIKELKNTLLGYYIEELSLFAEPSEAEIFKQQVRTLFEESNKNDR